MQDNQVMQYPLFLKQVDLAEPTSLLDHVHFRCTQRECNRTKGLLMNTERCSNRKSLPEQLKSCLVVKNSKQKRSLGLMTWEDMQRNPWKYIAKRQVTKVEQLHEDSTPCLDDNPFKQKEELETVGAFVKGLLSNPLEMLVHVTQWKTRHSLVGTQTSTSSHKMDKSL